MPNSEVVLELAEEFLERYRNGERPPLQEYVDRRPDLAGEIREVFPAMAMMEKIAIADASLDRSAMQGSRSGEPLALQQIGDYRIIREVGRGGMGIVFEAEQVSLGRHVALKVLPRNALIDKRQKRRFEREAKAAAKLHHTNIVPVFGVGDHDDMPYYVMQFIQGLGLDDVLLELRRMNRAKDYPETESANGKVPSSVHEVARSMMTGEFCAGADRTRAESRDRDESAAHPETANHSSATLSLSSSSLNLPGQCAGLGQRARKSTYWQSVAHVGVQVAGALEYAHKQGILHRDIKPSNLLLDMRGTVWVTDFGLAKANDHQDLTHTGDIVGTLRYMPPEAFDGRADARSDVFALGLTLYELLALQPAFPEKDRHKLLKQVTAEDAPRLDRVNPGVPRDLVTIVHKAADRDPARRYQTAGEMAADLQRFLDDEPIHARRISAPERFGRWCRRNPTVASLSATVLLLLLAVAVVSTTFALRLNVALNNTKKAQVYATDKLWGSYLSQAAAQRLSRQPGQSFASLRAIQEAMKLPVPEGRSREELRTEAIAALMLPDLEVAREWDGFPVGSNGFAIDNAFERYARGDRNGNVSVRRVSDDQELAQLPGAGPLYGYGALQFSPDGRYLHQFCFQQAGGFRGRLWKLDGAEPIAVLDDEHFGVAFRPDGRQFATAYADQSIRLFDCETMQELKRYPIGFIDSEMALSWNPKRAEILLWTKSALRLLDLHSGELVTMQLTSGAGISWTDWHPDGRLLAVCGSDLKIYIYDVVARRLALPPLEGHRNSGLVCRFSHTGDRLASIDWNSSLRIWDVRTGQLLLSRPTGGNYLHFSRDDRILAAELSSPKVRLFEFRRGGEYQTVLHMKGEQPSGFWGVGTPTLDREGRLLAVPTQGSVALVDIARGEEVAQLALPHDAGLAFEPDGTLLTCGQTGVLRWRAKAGDAGGVRYERPERLWRSQFNLHSYAASADVRVLGVPDGTRGVVLHRDRRRRVSLGPQNDVRDCAVSPDGRWVVTGSHSLQTNGPGAKVWNAETGEHVADLPTLVPCGVRFSPDGRWLLTTGGGSRIWRVGTWDEGPELHGPAMNVLGAFSHDGAVLALGDAPGVVRLVVPESGREVARLTTLEQARLLPCCFTPDGARLICLGMESEALHIFDLRLIRRELAELGLDWDAPAIPEEAATHEPLRIEAPSEEDVGRWLVADRFLYDAQQLRRGGNVAEMLRLLRRASEADPNHATAQNDLAWALLTGPEATRDPKQALTLARKAVSLASDTALFENTLGVALYRNSQFAEAVPVFEKSLRDGKGVSDAFDLFFLAMCHHRLGDSTKAQDCRQRAARWFEERRGKLNKTWLDELTAFQAEADAVLAQPAGK